MRRCCRNWIFLVALGTATSFFSACGPERNYKLLSTLFDGVPTPEQRAAQKAAQLCPCSPDAKEPAGVLAEADLEATAPEKPRPAIEQLKTWEEVLQELPADPAGGPDWVQALKHGVIGPRTYLASDLPPAAPFTLDTLVAATIPDSGPPFDLDIEIVPPKAPFYKVLFPHSSHTLWLNCSSCHPGIVVQRGSGMQTIFNGDYCGKCHGKVSFAPKTGCVRCHSNLRPVSPEAIDADLATAKETAIAGTPELVEQGQALYMEACAVCHGENGDGNGFLGEHLNPRPRDFTAGKYKFRSTNSSSIPTDFDLFRTITQGIPGTSMPNFAFFTQEERFALVHFIKEFSERFATQKPAEPIEIQDPPPLLTPELMELGKEFYKMAECNKCHGDEGRGDGPTAPELKDDWDQPLRPFDFTSGKPRGGSKVTDYYRNMMTGLQGTPMPDFGDVFEPEQAWGVSYYVRSLGDAQRNLPPAVKGDVRFERGPANSGAVVDPVEMPPATFPHWFHRMRVRCNVCHPSVFEMQAGANSVTMDAIREGKFCGKCHPSYPDGKSLAWPVTFESCTRCHVLP